MSARVVCVSMFGALLGLLGCAARPTTPVRTPLAACLVTGDCGAARLRCAGGDAAMCAALGQCWGSWVAADQRFDTEQAADFHELGEMYLVRACTLNTTACDDLVQFAETAGCHGLPRSRLRALSTACALGALPACRRLADASMDGVDVAYDASAAARIYVHVCDAVDDFQEFHHIAIDGTTFAPLDPMRDQLTACVRAERIAQLALVPAAADTRANTTPERALELRHARAANSAARSYRVDPLPDERTLASLREEVRNFADPPDVRARAARRMRDAELRLCGPISGAPAISTR